MKYYSFALFILHFRMPQKQRKDRHFPHGKRCELADGDAHSCTCYRTVPV